MALAPKKSGEERVTRGEWALPADRLRRTIREVTAPEGKDKTSVEPSLFRYRRLSRAISASLTRATDMSALLNFSSLRMRRKKFSRGFRATLTFRWRSMTIGAVGIRMPSL